MLEVKRLSFSYGKHLALDGVELSVARGEAVAILGANGAGKTSLLKAIAGLLRPAPGAAITFDDSDLTGLPAHEIVGLGIALVPEGRGVFGALTVEENLRLGANPARARDGENARRSQVYDLFPRLAERRRQTVATMSGGEQQMVALGRALMSQPELLLLDEPSLGLAPIMVAELFEALARVRETGVALLLVEQNVRESLTLAERGYLLEAGRVVGADSAGRLAKDENVQRAFLGIAAGEALPL